jgi:hypothetical protein
MSAAAAHATLRGVCAGFLAVALEAAAAPDESAIDPGGVVDAAASPPPPALPLVTVRLAEAPPTADGGGARFVERISCDLWQHTGSPVLPEGPVALARALTGGACAREWATKLWKAGVARLDARTAAPADAFIRCFSYLVRDELAAQDAEEGRRAWVLPLLPAGNAPKQLDMLRGGGLSLELTFRAREAAGADLPSPPSPALLVSTLTELVRACALLGPPADVQLELGSFAAAPGRQEERDSADAAALLPAGDAPALQPQGAPTLQEAVVAAVKGSLCAGTTAERAKAAVAAFLRGEEPEKPAPDAAPPADEAAAGAATGEGADAALDADAADAAAIDAGEGNGLTVALGHAEHASGAGDKRVVWSLTAVVARAGIAPEPARADEPPGADVDAADAPAASLSHLAGVYCFCQSALQADPPTGVLDCLRAKTTTAEWKTAFGLHLRACETAADKRNAAADDAGAAAAAAAECASLRFFAHEAHTVHPTLLLLHRRCTLQRPPGAAAAKLPMLGRKTEAALVKAALFAALADFKAATGGGTSFERGMRTDGLPAVALAAAKIVMASGLELRVSALTLVGRHQEQQLVRAEREEDDGQLSQAGVQQAVLDALLKALDASVSLGGGAAAAASADDEPAAANPPDAGAGMENAPVEQDAAMSSDGEEDLASLQSGLRGVRARSDDGSSQDAIFPTQPTKRRVGASPSRAVQPEPTQPAPASHGEPADEDDGWFM